MAVNPDETEAHLRLKNQFAEFLDQDEGMGPYNDKIRMMLDRGEARLLVGIVDVRKYDHALAEGLINRPMEHIPAIEDALKDHIEAKDEFRKHSGEQFTVGIEGDLGINRVSPRGLAASFLGELVAVDGIVTKCAITRPKIVRSVHFCEKTKEFQTREYRDGTSIRGLSTTFAYPTKDNDGNPLTTEFGLCQYRDFQTISIQEMPELAPAGQLPRSVDVVLQDDLCGRCKPGDRVRLYGIYRAMPRPGGGSGIFKTIVIANNLLQLRKDSIYLKLSDEDVKNIKAEVEKGNIFETAAGSLAPSIYGLAEVKRGLLLLLLGGEEKNLENGTHLRGDVNILMVGDPSTAKSQLLRCVHSIAPLAINTTGRGSTGVGLTAAVNSDADTGDRRLEAGAMVLADRGVVCIDEFDKMSDADRVAIHEVMEQQTVTIAKAGIHTTLNARCSVVAAANPIYGQYDPTKDPQHNVGLPDSLLSRFDLLFIVLDDMTADQDRSIASHVIGLYNTGIRDSALDTGAPDQEPEEDDVTPIHPKGRGRGTSDLYTAMFLRKYIHYARSRVHPVLTSEASEFIVNEYVGLRQSIGDRRTLPVTARLLETHIRLATAHAKSRLDSKVSVEDAKVAKNLLQFSLKHNTGAVEEGLVPPSPVKRTREKTTEPESVTRPATRQRTQESQDTFEFTEEMSDVGAEVTEERLADFMDIMNEYRKKDREEHGERSVYREGDVIRYFRDQESGFTPTEINTCLNSMQTANQLMRHTPDEGENKGIAEIHIFT